MKKVFLYFQSATLLKNPLFKQKVVLKGYLFWVGLSKEYPKQKREYKGF